MFSYVFSDNEDKTYQKLLLVLFSLGSLCGSPRIFMGPGEKLSLLAALGVYLAALPYFYARLLGHSWFSEDYLRESCNKTLGTYELRCPEISKDLKELFKTHGVVVLRDVFPPDLLEDLLQEARCRLRPNAESTNFAFSARNVWMDSEVFAKFVFEKPLGCLAAQLIPKSATIRYGHEELKMIMEGQNGTEEWHTDLESNLPDNLSGSVPLVRFWLPLIKQNLSNVTGGSLQVFPMNHFKKLRKFYPPCFEADGRLKGICLAMNNLAAAPALAPGDLLLYSPLIPHRTQPLTESSGSRMSLSGTLYEPKLLRTWVKNLPVPASWMASLPTLGACWDNTKKEMHGNFNWQSAGTQDMSDEGSACFPQVYPQPEEDEVTKRFSQKLLNPFGPKLVKTRFFLQIFPVHRLLGGSTTGSIASMASMVLH